MVVIIDWVNSIIHIPRKSLTLIQTSPTEIRELQINDFRLELKSLEATNAGITHLKTHTHNTEVALGGITFARVVEILEPYTITFEDGKYAVNLAGANSNIGDKTNVNQVSIRSANAAGLISSPAIEFASFNGGVIVDVNSPYAGTIFPRGTEQMKVNNIKDALLIAEYRGFNTIYLHSDIVLGANAKLENFIIEGKSHVYTNVEILSEALCEHVTIKNCNVTGILDGGTHIAGCVAGNIIYVNGHIHNSGLYGLITLGGNESAVLADCFTIDQDNPVQIDMGESGQDLAMPNYSGMAMIRNLTSASEEIGIGLNAGMVILDDTITAGTIVIAGSGIVHNNTGPNTIVNIDGLMSKETIANAVWNEPIASHLESGTTGLSIGIAQFGGFISINVNDGISGTTFPIGTQRVPVNNLADAISIATTRGIKKLLFLTDFTFVDTDYIENYELYGHGSTNTIISFEYGSTAAYCEAFNTTLTGQSFGLTEFTNCILDNYGSSGLYPSDNNVMIINCLIKNEIFIPANYTGKISIIDSYSLGITEAGDRATLNCNGANFKGTLKGYHGSFKIKNCTHADTFFSIDLDTGRLTLDETCIAGTFKIRGVGLLDNNSTGTIINTVGLISKNTISDAVINSSLIPYTTTNTIAHALRISNFQKVITIEVENGFAGTEYPTGTVKQPSNNIVDAVLIAQEQGITTLRIHGNYTFDNSVNIQNYYIEGDSKQASNFTFEVGATAAYCQFANCKITGSVPGIISYSNCYLQNVQSLGLVSSSATVIVQDCLLQGTLSALSNFSGNLNILDSWMLPINEEPSIFDMNGGAFSLQIKNLSGYISIMNSTEPNDIGIFINGGVRLDSTVIAGNFTLTGIGNLINEATSITSLNTESLLSKDSTALAVWETPVPEHTVSGSFGELLTRAIGLMQENHYLDETVYISHNGQKLLTSGRIRLYTNATSVGTTDDVLTTYNIQATYTGDELDTYKVTKT